MAKGKDDDQLQDEALEQAPAPGRKKRLLFMLIGIVALLVLVGGGVGVWLLMAPAEEGKQQTEQAAKEEEHPPIYEKLETFTVNLADREHYLQVEVALKLSDSEAQQKVKLYMPEVRDVLLRLLSSKTYEELGSQEGKDKLASEIQAQLNDVLRIKERGKGVKGVLFNSFIIQ
ncbi:flagellar FliL protein [Sulfuritortus calidifontis]|uniref:Flagellar protein FliL n=1 Tax=Sulfuritortus calidifontis TaxID=1914471 RepID=A0A4R3JYX9_9PROT|nr:flagellar basal body-associated protein FliL [Sulfuritortus calidifontis]TCS73965.1 flagellar FliL protein [Sulfuritortus calidifontis]